MIPEGDTLEGLSKNFEKAPRRKRVEPKSIGKTIGNYADLFK